VNFRFLELKTLKIKNSKNQKNKIMIETQWPLWEVFVQANPGIPHKHVGSVHAPDAEMAIQNARDVYTRRSEGISIWVVPANAIAASSPEDQGSFFEPSNDKPYRHPTFYKIPEGVKYL
jgi:ring-1,2-phenylacetyl-CoA epoxidase subunit PaaB